MTAIAMLKRNNYGTVFLFYPHQNKTDLIVVWNYVCLFAQVYIGLICN